jgi:hypothetical protein
MKIFFKNNCIRQHAVMIGSLNRFMQNKGKMTNPLLQKKYLQYQAPNFSIIKDEHFNPFEYMVLATEKLR